MTTRFEDDELERLLKFIGYGTLNADVWFLGMEEAGGGYENLRQRLKFEEVEDCANAHRLLGITKHHEGKRIIQPTWAVMCRIMLSLENQEVNAESVRNYQAEMLGRRDGRTLLTELLPIPKPNIKHWDYGEIFPMFESREHYYETIKPERIEYLKNIIDTNKPKTVIGYGKEYWADYKRLFPKHSQYELVNSFEIAKNQDTLVILTHHLPTIKMNGKFREIANIIRNHTSSKN